MQRHHHHRQESARRARRDTGPSRFYDLTILPAAATAPLGPVCTVADSVAALDRQLQRGRALTALEISLLKETHKRIGFMLVEQGGWL